LGGLDRLIIQELIKEVAQTQQVDSSAKKQFKGISSSQFNEYHMAVT
jgi:hypothetical protein